MNEKLKQLKLYDGELNTYDEIFLFLIDKYKIFIEIAPFVISTSNVRGYRFTYNIVDLDNVEVLFYDTSPLGFLNVLEAREDSLEKVLNHLLEHEK